MTELATRELSALTGYVEDPTGGRLVAWAQAAGAANQLARALVATTFVPTAFKGNVGDATAVILMGDELGLSPLASLRSIYAVHGTPALYARTMVALALSRGHQVWTKSSTDSEVTVCGQRRGSDKVETSTWTMARAQKAGYTGNKKYASNPQEMLYSKAAGEVCRKVAADVLAGVPFSVEDLELEPTTTTVKRDSPNAGKARRKVIAPETPEPDLDEPAPDAEMITDAQSKKMHATYNDLGITDRAERLADAGLIVGREIGSSTELTKTEATRLIDDLTGRLDPPADDPTDLYGGTA